MQRSHWVPVQDIRLKFVSTPETTVHPIWGLLLLVWHPSSMIGLHLCPLRPISNLGLYSCDVSGLIPPGWSAHLGLLPSSTVPGILLARTFLASITPGSLCYSPWSSCYSCRRSSLVLTCLPRPLSCPSLFCVEAAPLDFRYILPCACLTLISVLCFWVIIWFHSSGGGGGDGRPRMKGISRVLQEVGVIRAKGKSGTERLWMPCWRTPV